MPFDSLPITDPTIEILQKVHKLLKRKQWIQYGEVEYDVRKDKEVEIGYCLIGAIRHVVGDDQKVVERCSTYLGFDYSDELIEWNDDKLRKKSGVLRRITLRINKAKKALLLHV